MILLVFIIKKDYYITFLYKVLKENIYGNIRQLRYVSCKRKWKQKFIEFLKTRSIISINLKSYIFINKTESTIVGLYVNDDLIIDLNKELIESQLKRLGKRFEIKMYANSNFLYI